MMCMYTYAYHCMIYHMSSLGGCEPGVGHCHSPPKYEDEHITNFMYNDFIVIYVQ